jgi:hypothetical protein
VIQLGKKMLPVSKPGQAVFAGFHLWRQRLLINPWRPTPEVNISNRVDVNWMKAPLSVNLPTLLNRGYDFM